MTGAERPLARRIHCASAKRNYGVNKHGWTPLRIAQGHRPGNFKPSHETIDAFVGMATSTKPSAFDPRFTLGGGGAVIDT